MAAPFLEGHAAWEHLGGNGMPHTGGYRRPLTLHAQARPERSATGAVHAYIPQVLGLGAAFTANG